MTLIGYSSASPDDTDAVIVGPNGQKVMLVSDACGVNPNTLDDENWTFDDSASTFISDAGPCDSFQDASFKPTNYENPDDDDLTPGGGPAGPYLNSLSLLAGGSPDGDWKLFVFDDNPSFHGFDLSAWALHLEIQPPPPAAPTPPSGSAGPASTTPTGKKACKKRAQAQRRRSQEVQEEEVGATAPAASPGSPSSPRRCRRRSARGARRGRRARPRTRACSRSPRGSGSPRRRRRTSRAA